jgi:hypothetical protein
VRRTPTTDDLLGLDVLHNATQHIRAHFRMDMTRADAQANLDARALIFRCQNKILDEYGECVTREEIEGALIIEREMSMPDPRRANCRCSIEPETNCYADAKNAVLAWNHRAPEKAGTMSNGMDERKFEHVVKWCLTAQMDVILLTMGEQGWALVAVVCSASGFGLFFTRPAPPKGATE